MKRRIRDILAEEHGECLVDYVVPPKLLISTPPKHAMSELDDAKNRLATQRLLRFLKIFT